MGGEDMLDEARSFLLMQEITFSLLVQKSNINCVYHERPTCKYLMSWFPQNPWHRNSLYRQIIVVSDALLRQVISCVYVQHFSGWLRLKIPSVRPSDSLFAWTSGLWVYLCRMGMRQTYYARTHGWKRNAWLKMQRKCFRNPCDCRALPW